MKRDGTSPDRRRDRPRPIGVCRSCLLRFAGVGLRKDNEDDDEEDASGHMIWKNH